jgi:hypothetical protein
MIRQTSCGKLQQKNQPPFGTSQAQNTQGKVYKSKPVNRGTIFFCVLLLTLCVLSALLALLPPIDWVFFMAALLTSAFALAVLLVSLDWGKYILEEDHLHVRALRCSRSLSHRYKVDIERLDKRINYRDLLSINDVLIQESSNSKPRNFINILYWEDILAGTLSISAPANMNEFLADLSSKMNGRDLSHIINPSYFIAGNWVVSIPIEECDFLDRNQLYYAIEDKPADDFMIALLQHGGKVILLCMVEVEEKKAVISTSPPEVQTETKVQCSVNNIVHLDYETIGDALADTIYDEELDKEMRVVDAISIEKMMQP